MRSINFFSVLLIISAIVFLPANLFSRVSIGSTDSPQDFSVLELFSNETMGLRLPQLTTDQRDALTATLPPIDANGFSPAMGLQIFNTTNFCVETWNGWEWVSLCEGETPSFITPPHFEAVCVASTEPRVVECFAELRRFSSTVTRLADVTNPGGHAANAESFTAAGVSFSMMPVTGGVFYMGAQANPELPNFDETADFPITQVGISSFFISQTEVTRGLYRAVMGFSGTVHGHTLTPIAIINPQAPDPQVGDDSLPINRVTWFHAVVFMNRLSVIMGRTPVYTIDGGLSLNSIAAGSVITKNRSANGFRLPTEAEWEYAARGGQMNEYTRTLGASGTLYRFSGNNDPHLVAWNNEHPRFVDATLPRQTQPVRSLAPNQLGVYDMSGNVSEWVWERNATRPVCCDIDPVGESALNTNTSIRGGAWNTLAASSRVTGSSITPSGNILGALGFRMTMSP